MRPVDDDQGTEQSERGTEGVPRIRSVAIHEDEPRQGTHEIDARVGGERSAREDCRCAAQRPRKEQQQHGRDPDPAQRAVVAGPQPDGIAAGEFEECSRDPRPRPALALARVEVEVVAEKKALAAKRAALRGRLAAADLAGVSAESMARLPSEGSPLTWYPISCV